MSSIEIEKIKINKNRRAADSQKVEELIESIRVNGLINPITLDRELNLIAGLHRLSAYRSLGYEEIECRIVDYEDSDRARLAEIDENLIRNELNALERGELWRERDRILETLGLRAKPGDNQYRKKGSETVSPPLKTTSELAKEAGYTERTYQHGKQIARDIVPEVKEQIKKTPIAKSPSTLLKIARAGSKEAQLAKQAEKAAQEAQAQQKLAELEQQKQVAAQAREQQKKAQLAMVESVTAELQAKQATRKLQSETHLKSKQDSAEQIGAKIGDEWLLKRQMIYCGNTTSKDFREKLPSRPVLALAPPDLIWNHDYLVDEAHVVAVLLREGHIYDFCHRSRMPFQFELVLDGIYVAICSHAPLLKPNHPINVEGVEGIIAYLISLYTKPGNFVVSPSLGHGEVLITCERLGRICFIGDENPEKVNRAICRWQQFTGQQAEKV